jgi:hypothetical protein
MGKITMQLTCRSAIQDAWQFLGGLARSGGRPERALLDGTWASRIAHEAK